MAATLPCALVLPARALSCHGRRLRATAEELYEEVGSIAMTLISVKIKRVLGDLPGQ